MDGGGIGFDSQREQEILLLYKAWRPGLRSTQPLLPLPEIELRFVGFPGQSLDITDTQFHIHKKKVKLSL
jgi:hypothetical protein